jgi:2'-5' RNA ligase
MKPNWFVALPIPADAWLVPLLADAPGGIRRFHPHDLHITVAFLGAASPTGAQAAWQTLADLDHPPIFARLGALRPMGKRKQPSAYAVTFTEGGEVLAGLIGDWRDDALAAAGARPERRPPLPHVTVARPPRRAPPPVRDAGLAWMHAQPLVGAEVKIEDIALYTWSEDRRSTLFQKVASRPLSLFGSGG